MRLSGCCVHTVPVLPHVFLLVLLGDRNITPIRFEFVLEKLPEGIVLHAERVVEHRGDVVLTAHRELQVSNADKKRAAGETDGPEVHSQYPDEALVQLGVGGLQVAELDGFA